MRPRQSRIKQLQKCIKSRNVICSTGEKITSRKTDVETVAECLNMIGSSRQKKEVS